MNIATAAVSSSAKVLYIELQRLAYASDRNGKRDAGGVYVYASRSTLGKRINRSERTAQRLVNELKQAGLIVVKRIGLTCNDHIYVMDMLRNGRSGSDNIGTSHINNRALNNSYISIVPGNSTATVKDDDKDSQVTTQQQGRQTAPRDTVKGYTAPKGRPTAKRPRISKADKEAARKRYYAHLAERLKVYNPLYSIDDLREEGERVYNLANMIADFVSTPSASTKINGRYVTASEYWQVIKDIDNTKIADMFDRIKEQEIYSTVRNKQAYMLASAYNAVQWAGLMKGASWTVR